MPRHLSTDNYIELRRTPYKKPKTCWRLFNNMRARPCPDISAGGCSRIENGVFP
jgi:hypothetical protein